MTWDELKDGQRIKVLDKIFYVIDGSIVNNEDRDIYITETQITSGKGLTPVANKGDIGIWNENDRKIYFSRINSDNLEVTNSLDFEDDYDWNDINEEIFEVLNEFGELGEKHE